jgi:hypothetical protein
MLGIGIGNMAAVIIPNDNGVGFSGGAAVGWEHDAQGARPVGIAPGFFDDALSIGRADIAPASRQIEHGESAGQGDLAALIGEAFFESGEVGRIGPSRGAWGQQCQHNSQRV